MLSRILRPQTRQHTYMKVRVCMLVVARPAPRGGESREAYMYTYIVKLFFFFGFVFCFVFSFFLVAWAW